MGRQIGFSEKFSRTILTLLGHSLNTTPLPPNSLGPYMIRYKGGAGEDHYKITCTNIRGLEAVVLQKMLKY